MRRCTNAVMVAVVLAVFGGAMASAATLSNYLPVDGVIQFHFVNFDVGTVYSDMGLTTYETGGANGNANLDTLPWTDLGGAYRTAATAAPLDAFGNPLWDSWGIAKLDYLTVSGSSDHLWAEGVGGLQEYAMFWGERDTLVQPVGGGSVLIKGNDMNFAVFEWDTTDAGYLPWADIWAQGPSILDTTNVLKPEYNGITGGTMLFGGSSVVPDDGNGFGTIANPYEYYDFYSPTGFGNGGWWANDPDSNNGWGAGPLNPSFLNVLGSNAKFQFTFGTTPPEDAAPGWLVQSSDPLYASYTPELSSSALMLLGFVPIGLGWWRRRKA